MHVVGEQERVESVNNVSAVNSGSEAAAVLIAEADLVTTAVGPQILAKIAGTIAKGLVLRHQQGNAQPLNIIACENMVRGTSQLKQHVFAALPQDEQARLNSTSASSIRRSTALCRRRTAATRWK